MAMPRYMITGYPTEFDDIMFSDSGREEVARIVESCLAAGRGAWNPRIDSRWCFTRRNPAPARGRNPRPGGIGCRRWVNCAICPAG